MIDLSTTFCNKTFTSPFVSNSGTFGYGLEYKSYFSPDLLGGITLKGMTLEPKEGNSGVRIVDTKHGVINSIGLENIGIEGFLKSYDRLLPKVDSNIIANIDGTSIDEYVAIIKRLKEESKSIDFIELNISCPNVNEGGISFSYDPELVYELVSECKKVSPYPIITKLSPLHHLYLKVAKRALDAKTDAFSLINTIPATLFDLHTKKPYFDRGFGGYSGSAILPIALHLIHDLRLEFPDVPIIGMGGVTSFDDALQMWCAGANLIGLGAIFFQNPLIVKEMIQSLESHLEKEKFSSLDEFLKTFPS